MVFRGTFRDGVVVPERQVDLPEGARVEFTPVKEGKSSTPRKGVKAKRVKKLFGLGIWREDPALGGTAQEIARTLRQRVMRRGASE